MSNTLRTAEIIDWWSDERGRVEAECRATRDAIHARIGKDIAALSNKELLTPGNRARGRLKRAIKSDLTMLARRLGRNVRASLEHSIHLDESDETEPWKLQRDQATLAASGVAAVGAIGLAGAAVPLAITSSTTFFVVSTTTISWPVVALAGTGAIAAAWLSPKTFERGTEMLRQRNLDLLKRQVDEAIFGRRGKNSAKAICPSAQAQLDTIKTERLANLR
jgi:hypothetical protein